MQTLQCLGTEDWTLSLVSQFTQPSSTVKNNHLAYSRHAPRKGSRGLPRKFWEEGHLVMVHLASLCFPDLLLFLFLAPLKHYKISRYTPVSEKLVDRLMSPICPSVLMSAPMDTYRALIFFSACFCSISPGFPKTKTQHPQALLLVNIICPLRITPNRCSFSLYIWEQPDLAGRFIHTSFSGTPAPTGVILTPTVTWFTCSRASFNVTSSQRPFPNSLNLKYPPPIMFECSLIPP